MEIKYFFSDQEGDFPAGTDELKRPFLIAPLLPHPNLVLKDYFDAIRDFLLKDSGTRLIPVLDERLGKDICFDDIIKILIRTEKHGALYHLASVEIFSGDAPIKLSVSTAVSEKSRAWLGHEADVLDALYKKYKLQYLPRAYFMGEVKLKKNLSKESMYMLAADWFEGFHEWHLSVDEGVKKQKISIWDLEKGYRFASRSETYEIFKQASKILTLYYDTKNFCQVYPWHHAAGDFVVKKHGTNIEVKLTTARRYDSIMVFLAEESLNPTIALIYFFLNLTIKMRLDKLDGTGEVAWADDLSVQAAIEGFFEALFVMDSEGRYQIGRVEDLLSLFKSFKPDEIERLFYSLSDLFQKENPADFSIIQHNMKDHVLQLYKAIQKFQLLQ